MSNRLLEYLPEWYHDILEFVEVTESEEQEVISVSQAIDQLFADQFVLTSSEQGVKRRERMLNIQSDPSVESLDFRKRRIINRYSTKPPFTIRYLQERLDFIVGKGRAIASVDPQNFVLKITANIESASVFKEVEHTVKNMKPANLIYQQETALWDVISLKEKVSKREITWNYRLDGSWRLGEKPFATLGTEVTII